MARINLSGMGVALITKKTKVSTSKPFRDLLNI